VEHTFLLEPGRWRLQGNWLERDALPIPVKGAILIAWSRDDWFTMVMKLTFPGAEMDDVALQYRGRLAGGDRQYTFVLQHTQLDRVEGEGWVTPDSVVQRYWAVSDRQRRTGFETLYRLNGDRYHLSSGIMAGHYLTSAMEATLDRQ
jgi:hypothetical protein